MKKYVVLALLNLAICGTSHAAKSNCDRAAEATAHNFFAEYSESFRENAMENLEDGEEFDEADMPGGLELVGVVNGVYSYGFGERQECACGFNVKTTVIKKKYCSGKVDRKSIDCDC